jgi:hypothetical protein
MAGNYPPPYERPVRTCPACGKFCFLSRKAARRWAKHRFAADRPRPYRCATGGDMWHVGHLPANVRNGTITREQAYAHLKRQENPTVTTTEPRTAIAEAFDRAQTRPRPAPRPATPAAVNGNPPQPDLAADAEKHLAATIGTPVGDESTRRLAALFVDLGTYRTVNDVLVTPALAKRIIELNSENNRNLKPTRKDRYKRDMISNRWREQTGQTIVIDTNGRVIDGNHRMHATAESGRAFRFDFTFGVQPENILVIDALAPRTAADLIKVAGGPGIPKEVQAIVRWVWAWDLGSPMGIGGINTPTPLEIVEAYEMDSDRYHAAADRGRDAVKRKLCAGSAAGVAFFLFNRIGASASHVFFDAFISGANIPETHAAFALREKLRVRHEKRYSPAYQLALIVSAWNRWNTLDSDGLRIPVYRIQPVKEGQVGNRNFPSLSQPVPLRAHEAYPQR